MPELLPLSMFTDEFHLDLHGSGTFLFLLIDLNRVCINIIKLAPNVPNSYLLIFIHKFIIFALTTNVIIIFIMYLYMYLLKSLEFIVVYVCIEVECIYFNCISTVFIEHVFIHIFLNISWIGSTFLFFNTCTIKFIEGKFYFEGRACYIGKIMPTCIE